MTDDLVLMTAFRSRQVFWLPAYPYSPAFPANRVTRIS